jgi:hypothetical protein
MSDDLVKRFEHLGKAADLLKAQAAEITRLRAVLTTARREGMEEAAKSLIEKYQSMVIRPNTPEAWCLSILQDLREMAGEKPHVITAADIDAAAIRAAAGEVK